MPKKILLADDSITIQKVVELTFSEGDYLVFTVGNGSQALKKIHEVRPDIALLDVIMPEANGYEVCEKVKRDPETARIPVLLLTGTFEPFDRKRAEAAGADGHLTKPFESQVLISRVEELIASAPPTVSDAPLSTHGVDTPPLEVSSGEKIPHTTGSPAPEGTEEAIRASIVPDRYDDYPVPSGSRPSSETDSVRTPRMAEAEISTSRTGGEPPDPMVETWDELASGLASAPAGERPAAEENPTPTHSFPSEETVSATDTGIFSRAPIVAEASSTSAPPPENVAGLAEGAKITAEQMDRIASRVLEQLSDRVVREIAWEVIPEIAESLIRQRIRELEEKITREG